MGSAKIYVRARTRDNRFTSVNVAYLDERSFRLFVAEQLHRAGIVVGVKSSEEIVFSTPLSKEEADAKDNGA